MRRVVGIAVAVAALFALTIAGASAHHRAGHASAAGGVSGAAFYANGDVYRTVGTPTDLSGTGAPEHSFDTIYAIAEQLNVAEAAPGDRDYNGGRWMVYGVSFTVSYGAALATYDANSSGTFDSAEEVEAAIAGGAATATDTGIRFECPVIPMPGGRAG